MDKTEENAQVSAVRNPLQDSNAIFSAFQKKFSTTVYKIRVNSLDREVAFRDVTVNEQKTLSKTTIQNERRKDIVYDTQCQLINSLCLEDGFSVYRLTEFDRIRLLMELYQTNYFKNEIKYVCKECGKENVYKLDFQRIIDRFDKFDLSDRILSIEDQNRVFKFTLNYPLVRTVSNFYKDYMKKYKGLTDSEMQILDNFGNIEYVNLFIKRIDVIDKDDPASALSADLTLMTYSEIEKLIDMFPQNVVFSEDGVINYITKNFIERLNSVFQYEKCAFCGAESSEGIGSLIDFF
jgi:hypothetical protein